MTGMSSFHKSFEAIRMSCRLAVVNAMGDLLVRSRMRFYSTEVRALEKWSFRAQSRRKKIDFGSYFTLILPVSAFGLGTWQVFRKFEKDKFLDEFAEKVKQPPVELPENLEELNDLEFCAIKVKGKFDHNRELYLGPRPEITDDIISKVSTLLSRSKGGYMVVTPFKLSDRNLTILVNRGWVPGKLKSPLTRKEGQITDEVELVGLVRLQQNREPLGARNMPDIGFWSFRDVEKMAAITGAAPVFLDADKASTVEGGPKGGQTFLEIRNTHVSYIYTWYGLALLSSWLWYKRYMQVKPAHLYYISKSQ